MGYRNTELTPEEKEQLYGSLRQKFEAASDDTDVREADAGVRKADMLGGILGGLSQIVSAESVSRGNKAPEASWTKGVGDAARNAAAQTREGRKDRMGRVLEGDRLDQVERDRSWQAKEQGRKEGDWKEQDADRDPTSQRSVVLRHLYKQNHPELAQLDGFESMSAAEIKAHMADPIKSKEAAEARAQAREDAKADRAAMWGVKAMERQETRDARREDKANEHKWKEEQTQKATDEKKKTVLNEVEDRRTTINQNLDIMDKMIDENGTWELTGSHNQDLDRLVDAVATDMAKLADPSSVARPSEVEQIKRNLVESGFKNKNSSARDIIAKVKEEVERRADSAYKIRGIEKPAPVKLDETPGMPSPPTKPKTVTQNGHTYTLNEKTGEYE